MSEQLLPKTDENEYNKWKTGFYGELGEGGNAKIRYLESVITKEDLDSITLISNIPGSETWDVRDLFQRDVDSERVEKQILPYFKDETKVKYFNPLTLILLPVDDSGSSIIKDLEFIEGKSSSDSKFELEFERSGFFKLCYYKHREPIGTLYWNDQKCYLVAIDGQHRLSALKRWKADPNSEFADWKIPVIILNIFMVDSEKPSASLLEIVRKTFIYINTKAERVNKAREYLLNDESVNAICTQELIQYSHSNDSKSIEDRDITTLPLLFFEWQGKVINNEVFEGPASIKNIEEIYNWFQEYILGDDGSPDQESVLCLKDLTPQLEGYGKHKSLSHIDAERIRRQFRKILLPGLSYFLKNFAPYRLYIVKIREIEEHAIEKSDNAQHAFMKLRFGSHNASQDQLDNVQREYLELIESFKQAKEELFDEMIQKDIGMRGIMYSFGETKRILNGLGQYDNWEEFSSDFTNAVNKIYAEGWFKSYNSLKRDRRKFLINLAYEESGSIINYRIHNSKDAFGALLVILICYQFKLEDILSEDNFENIWGDYSSSIRKTYERGFRKSVKVKLAEDWKGTIKAYNEKVKKEAEKLSNKRVKELYDQLCNE